MKLSFEFALEIIKYVEQLEEHRKFVIANQLLKSGTSIGANVRESQSAESRSDFVHKLKLAAKEANETEYWLLLCQQSEHYPKCSSLIDLLFPIQKLLSSIIASTKSNAHEESALVYTDSIQLLPH